MKKKSVLVLCLLVFSLCAFAEGKSAEKKEKAKDEPLPMITGSVTVKARTITVGARFFSEKTN